MEDAEYSLMDAAEDRMWWYRALHARLGACLAPVRGMVLDAGCGTGGFLAALGRVRPDLARHGLEFEPNAAQRAAGKSGAEVLCGDVNAMPYPDAMFDAVVSADVLCHAAVHPPRALAEMARVLRPGGLLVINMPAYAWLLSAHDRRVHNARRVTRAVLRLWLVQAGFTPERVGHWNMLLLPLMIAQRKLIARDAAASDVAPFSPWLDAMFHAATVLERQLPFPLPAGGSVLATARLPLPGAAS
jgi:SAM-dependent methyltransferase